MRLGFYPQPARMEQADGAPESAEPVKQLTPDVLPPRRGEAGRVPQAGLTRRHDDSPELSSGTQPFADAAAKN